MSLTKVSYSMIGGSPYNVLDFGAVGDGSTNDTAAIQLCINSVGNGSTIYFPKGNYKTTAPILCENKRGIKLLGSPGQLSTSGSRIIAYHTGKCTLSLIGSLFCVIESLSIEGDTSARPEVGLVLGRSSAASAGNHTFISMQVSGYYQQFGLYNVASEENTFINCYIVAYTASVAGLYMSQGDVYSIGGLTGSSMESNTFIGGTIGNIDNTAGSAGIYLDMGSATGHHSFFNTFMTKNGGDAFIYINLGVTDGLSSEFPISFYNVVGEKNTNGPGNGIHIYNAYSGRVTELVGLTALNSRFQTPNTNTILCTSVSAFGVTLIDANISTPYQSTNTLPSTFQNVERSHLHLSTEATVTIGTLKSSYVETNAPVVLTADLGGNVRLDNAGTSYAVPAFTQGISMKRIAPTYGATISINAYLANEFDIVVTNGTAFTISNPLNPVDGQRITIRIKNTSGGAVGAITFGGAFLLSAWTSPATGFSRSIDFIYSGLAWVEVSRTQSDVPN